MHDNFKKPAACAYTNIMLTNGQSAISTLEQKCTYMSPVPLDKDLTVVAQIVKEGKSVLFFEGFLYDDKGALCVKASQTALKIASVKKIKQTSENSKL